VIKDNVLFGNDDLPKMSKGWDKDKLTTWGVGLPKPKAQPVTPPNPVKTIFLAYPEDVYTKVKEQLLQVADNPKDAVLKLLDEWGKKP